MTVEAVALQLYEIPTHGVRYTLQFSFASKLVHMLRPHSPVYDSMVAAFFIFPKGPTNELIGAKLQRLLGAYNFLTNEYQRVLNQGLLDGAIIEFQNHFDPNHILTQEKIVDTLIWRFVTLLRSQPIEERQVIYQ